MSEVDLLATGYGLTGGGVRAIAPVLEDLISEASTEVQAIAYLIAPSAAPLINLIEKAAKRGVAVTLVVNRLANQNQRVQMKLRSLARDVPHFQVHDFNLPDQEIHAKVVVADRKRAVVGSANLSWGGMYGNYEIGLLVGGEVAWKLATLIDRIAFMCKLKS
jgi:Phosphatidylserine/phosphatidylglycerophosphate/cardiolipin synthases and related enzymes